MVALQNERLTTAQPVVQTQASRRVVYLDNLRIYLTILVILHHAAIAYGGAGDWPVKDPAVDSISPILLAIFNAVNQAYFMSAFFLLAGYFTPRALTNKGITHFLSDRLIRLGVPLLLYSTLIVNVNQYVLDVYYRRVVYAPFIGYNAGHLWFVQALLIFSGVYACYWLITRRRAMQADTIVPRPFPTNATWFAWVCVLAQLTFAVRLFFPVGVWVRRDAIGPFCVLSLCLCRGHFGLSL